MERRHQLATMDLEAAAQRMTRRPDMRFQGVQDPAIQAIQQGESPVVAVMPTGRGKSMLFIVPTFTTPRGTTIVMVPLVALRADMTRRCQELGISCIP
jgi:superfamily II DNA helicase RecQ